MNIMNESMIKDWRYDVNGKAKFQDGYSSEGLDREGYAPDGKDCWGFDREHREIWISFLDCFIGRRSFKKDNGTEGRLYVKYKEYIIVWVDKRSLITERDEDGTIRFKEEIDENIFVICGGFVLKSKEDANDSELCKDLYLRSVAEDDDDFRDRGESGCSYSKYPPFTEDWD